MRAVGGSRRLLGRQVRSKLAPRSHFFAFFSQDASKLRFLAFSDGFSMDFGRYLGVFWQGFPMIFPKNAILKKNSVFPRENQ